MIVRIDPGDPTPPYEQLRRQIAAAVASGTLAPGDRLPTVRQLAGDLGVANGTVMRAYAELEAAGVVVTGRGAGTTVAHRPASPDPARSLDDLARAFVAQARALGLADEQVLAAVKLAFG